MRAPQYGHNKGKRRANNALLPAAPMVRGINGKPARLDLDAKHPVLGRSSPPRDKRASRNDNRHWQWGSSFGKHRYAETSGRYATVHGVDGRKPKGLS